MRMTIRHKVKRHARLIIAAAGMMLMIGGGIVGIMMSNPVAANDDAPEHVEKLVTDFSKYVMLHQTRGESSLLLFTARTAPCSRATRQVVVRNTVSS